MNDVVSISSAVAEPQAVPVRFRSIFSGRYVLFAVSFVVKYVIFCTA